MPRGDKEDDVSEFPLAVGDKIHGFACGAFGRDHYNCVRVEAVGSDWVVTRDPELNYVEFASGEDNLKSIKEARDERCPNDYCYFDGMWFNR